MTRRNVVYEKRSFSRRLFFTLHYFSFLRFLSVESNLNLSTSPSEQGNEVTSDIGVGTSVVGASVGGRVVVGASVGGRVVGFYFFSHDFSNMSFSTLDCRLD